MAAFKKYLIKFNVLHRAKLLKVKYNQTSCNDHKFKKASQNGNESGRCFDLAKLHSDHMHRVCIGIDLTIFSRNSKKLNKILTSR